MFRSLTCHALTTGILAVSIVACGVLGLSHAADRPQSQRQKSQAAAVESLDLFAAMQKGDIQVKVIPNNDKEANVIIKNRTKRPISVRLPEAFAGVPVLAQQGFGMGNNNRNNNNNNNNQNQALGGGFGGGGLGGGLGGGGLGGGGLGGAFNIAPEKEGKLKVACVCLEHGKENPNPRVAYEMKPIESYTKDIKTQTVIKLLASGHVNQRIAQAAAWHFANGLSWEQLAAKKIDRLGRPDEPYFSRAELNGAVQVAALAEKTAKESEKSSDSSGQTASLSH